MQLLKSFTMNGHVNTQYVMTVLNALANFCVLPLELVTVLKQRNVNLNASKLITFGPPLNLQCTANPVDPDSNNPKHGARVLT
jgi:hypothetical protein